MEGDYTQKSGVKTTWRWLRTGKGECNREPRVGPYKLSFGLKMIQNVPKFKLKKEISNAQYTLGFICHPRLKLRLWGVSIYLSRE